MAAPTGPNNKANPYYAKENHIRLAKVDSNRSEFFGTIGGVPDIAIAPVITGVPTIDNTSPAVGDTLTATAAPVTGTPTPTRIWEWANATAVLQTGPSNQYTVPAGQLGEVITAKQIETNVAGTAEAKSLATDPVVDTPELILTLSVDGPQAGPGGDLPVSCTITGAMTNRAWGIGTGSQPTLPDLKAGVGMTDFGTVDIPADGVVNIDIDDSVDETGLNLWMDKGDGTVIQAVGAVPFDIAPPLPPVTALNPLVAYKMSLPEYNAITPADTWTLSGINLADTVQGDRLFVSFAGEHSSSNPAVTGLTLGGVVATEVKQVGNSGGGRHNATWFTLEIGANLTNIDAVVTFATSVREARSILIYNVRGASTTLVDQDEQVYSAGVGNTYPIPLTVDTEDDGAVLMNWSYWGENGSSHGPSATVNNMTVDSDIGTIADERYFGGASAAIVTGQIGLDVAFDQAEDRRIAVGVISLRVQP